MTSETLLLLGLGAIVALVLWLAFVDDRSEG